MDYQFYMNSMRTEAAAVAELIDLGVTISTNTARDVAPRRSCTGCAWHVVSDDGEKEDGGLASSILSWVKDGHLGEPENLTMYPVTCPA